MSTQEKGRIKRRRNQSCFFIRTMPHNLLATSLSSNEGGPETAVCPSASCPDDSSGSPFIVYLVMKPAREESLSTLHCL